MIEFTLLSDIQGFLVEGPNAGSLKLWSTYGETRKTFSFMVDTQPPLVSIQQQNPLRYSVSDGNGTGLQSVRPWVVTTDGRFSTDRDTVVYRLPQGGSTSTVQVNQNASLRFTGSLIDFFDGAGHRVRVAPSGRTESEIVGEVLPAPLLPPIPPTSSTTPLFGPPCRFERVDVVGFFNLGVENAQIAGARLTTVSDTVIDGLELTEGALAAHRYDLSPNGLRPNNDATNKRLEGYTAAKINQGNLPVSFYAPVAQGPRTHTRLDIRNENQMGRLRAHVQGLNISASPKTLVIVAVDELMEGQNRSSAIGLAYGAAGEGTQAGDGFIVFETGNSQRAFAFPDERKHVFVHELGHLMGLDHVDTIKYRDPINANATTNYMHASVDPAQERFTLRQAVRFMASLCGSSPMIHTFNQSDYWSRKSWTLPEVFACNNGLTGFDEETESEELLNGKRCLDGGPMPPVESPTANPRPESRTPNLPATRDERWCWCFGEYETKTLGRKVGNAFQIPATSEDRLRPKIANKPAVIDIAFHNPAVTSNIYAKKSQVSQAEYEQFIKDAEQRIAIRVAADEQLAIKTSVVGQLREWSLELRKSDGTYLSTGIKVTLDKDLAPFTLIYRKDTASKVTSPVGTGYFAP